MQRKLPLRSHGPEIHWSRMLMCSHNPAEDAGFHRYVGTARFDRAPSKRSYRASDMLDISQAPTSSLNLNVAIAVTEHFRSLRHREHDGAPLAVSCFAPELVQLPQIFCS